MTGAELHARIAAAAQKAGVPVNDFARPLNPSGIASWLKNLQCTAEPKPRTIERVESLIAGETVPRPGSFTPAPRQIWRDPGSPRFNTVVTRRHGPREAEPAPSREPCPRCGVRGDIGCRHNRRFA